MKIHGSHAARTWRTCQKRPESSQVGSHPSCPNRCSPLSSSSDSRYSSAPPLLCSQALVTRNSVASLGEFGLITLSLKSLVNQNIEMSERLKAVEEKSNGRKRVHTGAYATCGASKRAKRSALRHGAQRVVESDKDAEDEDVEDVLWEKNMLSKKAQKARKILQVCYL